MITEKQVRDAMVKYGEWASSETVKALKAAGLVSPEPDKPLLWNSGHTYITGTQTLDNDVLAAHQAALDEFARAVEEAGKSSEDPITRAVLWEAGLSARKAGLTKVGV